MTTITDVRREITVGGTPERAFDLFTTTWPNGGPPSTIWRDPRWWR